MSRQAGQAPIRRWVGLALALIIAVPLLTTLGLYAAGTWWQQRAESTILTAARRAVGSDAAHWTDPAWQSGARRRLARLGVDALLVTADGRQLFATTTMPLPRRATGWQVWDGVKVGLPRGGGTAAFFVRVVPPGTILTGALAGGLLALLPTLAGAGWFLGHTVVRPLTAMSRAARGVRDGHLDVMMPASRVQEVAEVASALEALVAGLGEAAQRQAALEQERRLFIGAVAHDLRTPVFTLRAYLGGLRDGLATTPEKTERYLDVCQAKVEALERLIADLFAFTRVEYLDQQPRREPLELGILLRQAVDDLQPRAEAKGITLALDAPPTPCPLCGDGDLLARAVANLLDNALRYTPAGGEVRVSWGVSGDRLVFRVTDTGPGLAPHDVPHLCTQLYRGEPSRNRQTGGAGLGLTIAQRILQAHGGELTAANGALGGAVFSGTLPLDRAASPTSDPVVAASS